MSFWSLVSKLIFISLFSVAVLNCKDDEVVKPTIIFKTKSIQASEMDSIVVVNFVLDKPAPEEITINLIFTGTATIGNDFEGPGSFKVSKGSQSASVELKILDDGQYEGIPETIYIFMEESNGVKLDTQSPLVVTIGDDYPTLKINLTWISQPIISQVDMNLFLWRKNEEGQWEFIRMSKTEGTSFESIELISIHAPDGIYGVSYQYYSGNCKSLSFKSTFNCLQGKLESDKTQLTFEGQYTSENLATNQYKITQTFVKSGYNYSSFSKLNIPNSGSRAVLE